MEPNLSSTCNDYLHYPTINLPISKDTTALWHTTIIMNTTLAFSFFIEV
ncbi:Hypothetical protein I595_3616 [Croceitalea dokdonensis DOKDO 023]|uniref:Uncharacterized protein n=1 Tax=Croceitalea dokdonensis DOKDO 023 TaxID=1300341 RepID=A0A0P7ARE0_9FLAO|nr:Hypothetical protein I595_3616 [Croceitalea dokdonensis DOKDO 023]